MGILGRIEHRVAVRQRVYASGEEARATDPLLGVSGGSGECAGVHVGVDEAEEESKKAMEMRRVREELKREKKEDLERMRMEREIRV